MSPARMYRRTHSTAAMKSEREKFETIRRVRQCLSHSARSAPAGRELSDWSSHLAPVNPRLTPPERGISQETGEGPTACFPRVEGLGAGSRTVLREVVVPKSSTGAVDSRTSGALSARRSWVIQYPNCLR